MDELESTLHVTASVMDWPKGTRVIVHVDGAVMTWPLPTRGTMSIGRATDADIRIDHPSVSRAHAVLHMGPPLVVEDLESHNGTRVRGVRLEPKARAPLTSGDVVKVGSTLLMIQPGLVPTDTARVLANDLVETRVGELLSKKQRVDVIAAATRGRIPFDIVLATFAAAVPREHMILCPEHEQVVVVLVDADAAELARVRERLVAAALGVGVRAGIGTASSAARMKTFAAIRQAALKEASSALPRRKKERDQRAIQHEAITLMNAATGLYAEERYEQARAMVQSALELMEADSVATMCLASVAVAAREHGDLVYARTLLERTAEIAKRSGDQGVTRLVAEQLAACTVTNPPKPAHVMTSEMDRKVSVGEIEVDLARRRPLWLLVSALARAHGEKRGVALGRDALLEAAWPGERMHPDAALNRLYVAIATLRRLGLRDVLLNRDDGYLFDPKIEVKDLKYRPAGPDAILPNMIVIRLK